MNVNIHQRSRTYWEKNGFRNLLLCLFVYLVIGPFFDQLPYAEFIVSGVLSITLLSAIGAMAESRKKVELAALVLGVALVLLWLRTFGLISDHGNIASVAIGGFLVILIFSFGHRLFKVRKVTGNVICSALVSLSAHRAAVGLALRRGRRPRSGFIRG